MTPTPGPGRTTMTDHRPRVADHANQLNAFGFLRLSGSFFVSFVASAFVVISRIQVNRYLPTPKPPYKTVLGNWDLGIGS